MSLVTVVAVVAVIVLVIGRQLKGEPLRGKRVILLPAVLIVFGAMNLSGSHPNPASIVCIGISAVIAVAIGLGQGGMMHLESRDGALWGQMPVRSLWLWAALIGSRLAMAAIAIPLGAHAASSVDSIVLVLGVNRLAQAAVIASRAMLAGIPFAAEKDGKTFQLGQTTSTRSDLPLNGASRMDIARRMADRFAPRS